jgi:pimeloyl-ACP methyl ester carboxylesterase
VTGRLLEAGVGGRLYVERLPNARGPVVIEGADHLLPMRRPEAFNRAMLEFLDGVRAA